VRGKYLLLLWVKLVTVVVAVTIQLVIAITPINRLVPCV
jgi:hypothetical protein